MPGSEIHNPRIIKSSVITMFDCNLSASFYLSSVEKYFIIYLLSSISLCCFMHNKQNSWNNYRFGSRSNLMNRDTRHFRFKQTCITQQSYWDCPLQKHFCKQNTTQHLAFSKTLKWTKPGPYMEVSTDSSVKKRMKYVIMVSIIH